MYGEFDFLIDLDDVERCKLHNWCIHFAGRKQHKKYFYALTQDTRPKTMLHRFVMNAPDDMVVDHINGNTFDTRKSNLRTITHKNNCRNRALNFNNSSGVRGVTWSKKDNKWMVYIMVNYRQKTLGYFDKLEDAAECRKLADIKYYGESDTMNH